MRKQKKKITLKKLRNKTARSLWVGDYDGDGTANIDDSRPFNSKKGKRVNKEISLRKAYLNLEERRRKYKK